MRVDLQCGEDREIRSAAAGNHGGSSGVLYKRGSELEHVYLYCICQGVQVPELRA